MHCHIHLWKFRTPSQRDQLWESGWQAAGGAVPHGGGAPRAEATGRGTGLWRNALTTGCRVTAHHLPRVSSTQGYENRERRFEFWEETVPSWITLAVQFRRLNQ